MAVYSVVSVVGQDHMQTVYRGKDNPIEVILKLDDADYDYTAAKVVRVKIGQTEFDSQSDPASFDRSESAIGKLKIFIGEYTNISPQTYNVKVEIEDGDDKNLYFGQVRVRIEDPGM